MPNDLCHFAILADDCERAKTFYESVFGWTFEPWGPPNFWLIRTSPGAVLGALQERTTPVTGEGMIGYQCSISVEDVEATADAIRSSGGALKHEPFLIESVGTLVTFQDTEGNVACAIQYLEGARG